MKSRILPHSSLPALRRTASVSSDSTLDVSALGASARVATLSAARRFDLQRNSSPRLARRREARRSGQALLLAVLIMLLAALLSAGFLAVLSGNLNQTARIADKTRAIEAARAGIAFANARLSNSAEGDQWRPVDVSPAPSPANASGEGGYYDQYYSQLDKVQGWANTIPMPARVTTTGRTPAQQEADEAAYQQALRDYRNNAYSKFPDPNAPVANAPKFLVKVTELPLNLPLGNPEYEHRGEIKITSIGLSDDDPNAFHRAIAYKTGARKSPWAQALRSVSNWNFQTNTVPQAEVASVSAAGITPVTITTAATPQFPPAPFNVVLSHKDLADPTQSATFGAVVTSVNGNVLTLSGALPTGSTFSAGDNLQMAAAIGTASTIDLLNTGATSTSNPPAPPLPAQLQPNGILTNGGTWLQGQINLANLSKNGTRLLTSGALAVDNAKGVLAGNALVTDIATTGQLLPSNAYDMSDESKNFPGSFIPVAGVNKTDLVNDGWNKLGGRNALGLDYTTTRDVAPFQPVKLDSADNLARYRSLTRDSNNGLYINNRDDVEKVNGTPMTRAQLTQMWLSPAAATEDFTRNGTPATVAPASLEQQHLRGWIAPDEFMPRGAQIELKNSTTADPGPASPNPFVRITLDPRSDANPAGPDANKAVLDDNGNPQAGVYTQDVVWPADGVIFAEGNLRIRGKVNLSTVAPDDADRFPSLTVVSQNNIYIEGSVSVDGPYLADGVTPNANRKKLMLLARQNVVVNPTRSVTGHVDAQTVSIADVNVAVGINTNLPVQVSNSDLFKVGDRVAIGMAPSIITAITSPTQIQVSTNNTTLSPVLIPANTPVVLLQWKDDYKPASPYFKVDATNTINRRILLQNAATKYPYLRLDLDHAGSRPIIAADFPFRIKTVNASAVIVKPTGLEVKVTNKRVDANGTVDQNVPIVQRDEKKLRATYNLPTPEGVDVFRAPTLPDFADETAAKSFSLKELETALNNTTHIEPPPPPPDLPKGWKYEAAKNNEVSADNVTPKFPDGTPAFYLAALGLRNDKFSSAAPTADNGVLDIGGAVELSIPLATSVRLTRNNVQQDLTATYTANVMGVNQIAEYTVPFIGFNPIFGVADATTGVEDALTVDQSFYQADTDVLKSTLDSRRLSSPFATGDSITLRQNDDLLGLAAGITTPVLPLYRVRALKLENTKFPAPATTEPMIIRPIDLDIDAYVYAQEGSWFVIPGDYFRTATDNPSASGVGNLVRSTTNGDGSYIDFDNNGQADLGEYINATVNGNSVQVADLNRNGIADPGELEAALRLVRYNYKINFFGAIVENQTPVVTDVTTGASTITGAVQDWMNKWAVANTDVNDNDGDGIANGNDPDDDNDGIPDTIDTDANNDGIVDSGANPNFQFINYTYDPAILLGTTQANQLRVPLTDDLIYQQ